MAAVIAESGAAPHLCEALDLQVFIGIEAGDPPFHTDEIDAGSVLHPCKVYFMSAASLARDGPPMVSSVVLQLVCLAHRKAACCTAHKAGVFLSNFVFQQAVRGTGQQAHMRPRPGFLCCRAWHIDDKHLLPLPLSKTSHKLAAKQVVLSSVGSTGHFAVCPGIPMQSCTVHHCPRCLAQTNCQTFPCCCRRHGSQISPQTGC